MPPLELTLEMMVVLAILATTVLLFVTEVFRIDFTAILVMVTLGLLSQVPGLANLADPEQLFNGFASNAVISIIAVMIIGAGLDKTGLMSRVAGLILKYGGSSEGRIIPIVSGTVGFISSFMQNVGAAALFLPVMSRISLRTQIPLSRLLMPMGFCAILGGTMTMVGSSPLILLNDLIVAANSGLPDGQEIRTFDLFDVTPIGIALVVSGILYFMLFGRFVLPQQTRENGTRAKSVKDYMRDLYGIHTDMFEVEIPLGSTLDHILMVDAMQLYHFHIVASYYEGEKYFLPPISSTTITAPCRLVILGEKREVELMAADHVANVLPRLEIFAEDYAPTVAGMAEIVVPPGSNVIGKCAVELEFRQVHGFSIAAIHRGGETLSLVETEDHAPTRVGLEPLRAGDTMVGLIRWDRLVRLTQDQNFVVVTQGFPRDELRPQKVLHAALFFLIALGLILFSDIRLSLCLLTGAAGMILTRVLSIEEAYEAVSWSTIFLLASLIPLGQAVQNTGTAEWIAQQILVLLDGVPVFGLQVGIAVLATGFTLVMSNVGATVLLVPLAISIALASGGDPAIFALTVAIATSNSFLIPTHQVNALIMGPAGYKVADFIKSGGIMTILFLVVSMTVMALFY
ncbi:MAG: SLC13 family permease [Pseudomonadota bacterium]